MGRLPRADRAGGEVSTADIAAAIAALDTRLAPLLAERDALKRQYDEARSREWIAANSVTRADVICSDEKGAPYHGNLWNFCDWIRTSGRKERWAEWNGRIYSSAELMTGRMEPDAPGRYEDVLP